jgi:hypothetical protein
VACAGLKFVITKKVGTLFTQGCASELGYVLAHLGNQNIFFALNFANRQPAKQRHKSAQAGKQLAID